MEVDSVRNENLLTFECLNVFYGHSAGELVDYTLPSIMDKLAISSNLLERTKMVEDFNRKNTWKKRGISRVPVVVDVMHRPTPAKVSILWDGSVVVEVGGIELGQGLHMKVKQMAAYGLGLLQCGQTQDLVDKVRVAQSDTLSLVQGGFTAGSTTSESSRESIRLCCNVLVERLAPVKKKLKEKTGSVDWNTLILEAHDTAVILAVNSFYVPDFSFISYLNYGAAVSEVDIDILTGESRILQTIEGAFVQVVGFFMPEEYLTNEDGLVVSDGTWTYKTLTIDTITEQFNVDVFNTGHHQNRILSSKVHCATRGAIKAARKQLEIWRKLDGVDSDFNLEVPAVLPVVKTHCGLDYAQKFLEFLLGH